MPTFIPWTIRVRTRRALSRFRRRKNRRVADRPHWIAIALGLLSPGLGLAALAISWNGYKLSMESLALSRESMVTGQRAYLAVRNGEFDFDDSMAPIHREGHIRFEIVNLGNTPARITAIVLRFTNPEGWSVPADRRKIFQPAPEVPTDRLIIESPGTLAQRTSHSFESRFRVKLTQQAWKDRNLTIGEFLKLAEVEQNAFRKRNGQFQIHGTITFIDVFNIQRDEGVLVLSLC